MKTAILLVLLIATASALSSYPEYVEATYSVTGVMSGGYAHVHVPFSDVMQDAAQLTKNEIFFDETGAFINATGRYNYTAFLRINASKIRISSNPAFPLDDMADYLNPSKFIDSNDSSVVQKAGELTAGKTKTLEAVAEITKWVYENVDYDLSAAGETRMKASDVLRVRRGVCGDYSALTAALLRASGIPARYVEGMLVISDNSGETHAWVEAYVAGSGWLPVDPTNGVFAAADRVKISSGVDPSELSDTIFYEGNEPSFENEEATVEVTREDDFEDFISAEPVFENPVVGFGSSVDLRVYLRNRRDYFVISDVRVYASEGVSVDRRFDAVVLSPKSEGLLKFSLIVPSNLSADFNYVFFASAGGPGFNEQANISANPNAEVVQRGGIRVKSVEVSASEAEFSITSIIENYGNAEMSVKFVASGDAGSQSENILLFAGGLKTVVFTFPVTEGIRNYSYNLSVYSGEITLAKFVPVIIPAPASSEPGLLGPNKVFIVGFIIIISAVLSALVYPRKAKKSKPKKRVQDDDFKRHLKKRKITHSIEFLEAEDKNKHGVEELEKPKHHR